MTTSHENQEHYIEIFEIFSIPEEIFRISAGPCDVLFFDNIL